MQRTLRTYTEMEQMERFPTDFPDELSDECESTIRYICVYDNGL